MFREILQSAHIKIELTCNLRNLEAIRVEFLGKQSLLQQEMKKLSSMSDAERRMFGAKVNELKIQLSELIEQKKILLERKELETRFNNEKLDLTIPSRIRQKGSIHPITQALEEWVEILVSFGFELKEGPNIETEYYNFTALNINENHPARQMHDSFYLSSRGYLLRTHTSPVQIRTLENNVASLPLRFISIGRTYRSDSDVTHSPMFHQIEGMAIDKNINFAHLKYLISKAIKMFFQKSDIEIRFRPSFFPFTEPSAEIDIKKANSDTWLEVLGCGMTHPNVLRNCNIDPETYQAFAFGLGLERLAMLKYGINDLRQFFEGDIRWLKSHNFNALDIPHLAGMMKI